MALAFQQKVPLALQFLQRLGLGPGATWEGVWELAEQLYGRPIHIEEYAFTNARTVTGLWVGTSEFGVVMVRKNDDHDYRFVCRLHEISHILVRYAPATALGETPEHCKLHPEEPAGAVRLCTAGDSSVAPAIMRLERFVEDVALELEHLMRVRDLPIAMHL